MRLQVGLTFCVCVILVLVDSIGGLKCPGACMSKDDCKAKKGKIQGYCSSGKPCCDLEASQSGSCSTIMKGVNTAVFHSPLYPAFLKHDLTCNFDFHLDPNYQGIFIEFVDFITDGLGMVPNSQCDGGMIIFSGFGLWRPVPRCGNLTGYSVLIEKSEETQLLKTLRILGIMSGSAFKWKIRITQILSSAGAKTTPTSPQDEENLLNWNLTEVSGTSQSTYSRHETQLSPSTAKSENVILDGNESRDLNFAEPLIQNGVDTNVSQVPWQASLRTVYPESLLKTVNMTLDVLKYKGVNCTDIGQHFCGGSIISDQHILTAAHCIEPKSRKADWTPIGHMQVFLGDTDLCLDDGVYFGKPSKGYSVERITFHYNYDHAHLINDIAVIKLTEKIKYLDYVKPIKLPPKVVGSPRKTPSFAGKAAKFSGWGLTNLSTMHLHPQTPQVLQYAEDFTVLNRSTCASLLGRSRGSQRTVLAPMKYRWMFTSTVCTNATIGAKIAPNLGQGDSGGPLFIQETMEDDPVQIGIASFIVRELSHPEVEQSLTDVYTNVAFFRSWIDMVLMM